MLWYCIFSHFGVVNLFSEMLWGFILWFYETSLCHFFSKTFLCFLFFLCEICALQGHRTSTQRPSTVTVFVIKAWISYHTFISQSKRTLLWSYSTFNEAGIRARRLGSLLLCRWRRAVKRCQRIARWEGWSEGKRRLQSLGAKSGSPGRPAFLDDRSFILAGKNKNKQTHKSCKA